MIIQQGKDLSLDLVIWIYGIAEIEHSRDNSVVFLFLIVCKWGVQPLVTVSLYIHWLLSETSVPKTRMMGYDVSEYGYCL